LRVSSATAHLRGSRPKRLARLRSDSQPTTSTSTSSPTPRPPPSALDQTHPLQPRNHVGRYPRERQLQVRQSCPSASFLPGGTNGSGRGQTTSFDMVVVVAEESMCIGRCDLPVGRHAADSRTDFAADSRSAEAAHKHARTNTHNGTIAQTTHTTHPHTNTHKHTNISINTHLCRGAQPPNRRAAYIRGAEAQPVGWSVRRSSGKGCTRGKG
jgi:hypothetical protein